MDTNSADKGNFKKSDVCLVKQCLQTTVKLICCKDIFDVPVTETSYNLL